MLTWENSALNNEFVNEQELPNVKVALSTPAASDILI
jgi:hypothetical protein